MPSHAKASYAKLQLTTCFCSMQAAGSLSNSLRSLTLKQIYDVSAPHPTAHVCACLHAPSVAAEADGPCRRPGYRHCRGRPIPGRWRQTGNGAHSAWILLVSHAIMHLPTAKQHPTAVLAEDATAAQLTLACCNSAAQAFGWCSTLTARPEAASAGDACGEGATAQCAGDFTGHHHRRRHRPHEDQLRRRRLRRAASCLCAQPSVIGCRSPPRLLPSRPLI